MLPALTYWNWTKSLRDGLPRLWHSDFLFPITKSGGKQVLKVVLLSHHNKTIKQDRPFHCLWKEYHPSAWLASGFMTQMHLRVKQCFDYYWFYMEDFIMYEKYLEQFLTFWNIKVKIRKNLPARMSGIFCLRKKRKGWKPQLWIFIILPSAFSIGMSWISLGMISRFHVWFWNTSFQRYWLPLKSTVC